MASTALPRPSGESGRRSALALERALSELALYDWLVLRSAGLAEEVLGRAGGALPGRLRVAAQGEGVRRVLEEHEVEAAVFVSEATPEALVSALAPFLGRCERLLVPLSAGDEEALLHRGLESAGGEPVTVVVAPPPGPGESGGPA